MAINLPSAPQPGDVLFTTSGDTYIFDGVAWYKNNAGGKLNDVAEMPATTPANNDILYWDGAAWVHRALPQDALRTDVTTAGDVIFTKDGYQYHEFKTVNVPGAISINKEIDIEFFMVGGGGGGGGNGGGGGGAGAVVYDIARVVNGSYNYTIGAGGAGGQGNVAEVPDTSPFSSNWQGRFGQDTTFWKYRANGGGGGGGYLTRGMSNGCGGGAGAGGPSAGLGIANIMADPGTLIGANMGHGRHGGASGINNTFNKAAGGGGGCNGDGGAPYIATFNNAQTLFGGSGGAGICFWGLYHVAGGGAGASWHTGVLGAATSSRPGVANHGFGGGLSIPGFNSDPALDNTGGGGGGGHFNNTSSGFSGGAGGSGILVIRYKLWDS